MSNTANLSTVIDLELKDALSEYCKRKGLKIQHVVESALIEKLEDEIDLEAYNQRKDEETIPLSDLI
jgi:hypothetical protein